MRDVQRKPQLSETFTIVISALVTGLAAIIAAVLSSGLTSEILKFSFPDASIQDIAIIVIAVAIPVSSFVISGILWLLSQRRTHSREEAIIRMREKEKELLERIRHNTATLLEAKSNHAR